MRKKKKIGVPVRTLIALLAVALLIGGAIGGTMAWLTAGSETVTNTFSPSDIKIILDEETKKNDDTLSDYHYKMVPGNPIIKDPKVTVKDGSEACWLFVKVEETIGDIDENGKYLNEITIDEKNYTFDDFLEYNVDSSKWNALDVTKYPGIYYYKGNELQNTITEDKSYNILTDDKVTVKATVTKEMMNGLTAEAYYPKLVFTAFASQYKNGTGNFTPEQAWLNIFPETP